MSEHEALHDAARPANAVAARVDWLLEGVMQETFAISHRMSDQEERADDADRLDEIEALLVSVCSTLELDQLAVLRRRHLG